MTVMSKTTSSIDELKKRKKEIGSTMHQNIISNNLKKFRDCLPQVLPNVSKVQNPFDTLHPWFFSCCLFGCRFRRTAKNLERDKKSVGAKTDRCIICIFLKS